MGANPIIQMVQMANAGRNPMEMMQQMAGADPRVQRVLQMIDGKSPAQIQRIAENMARERGVSIDSIAKSLGLYRQNGR